LVSNIGEKLNINRFEIEENDLVTAKNLFNQYKGSPNFFKTDDARCKIISINDLLDLGHWEIDRLWSKEEKEKLGIQEKGEILSIEEFKERLHGFSLKMNEYVEEIEGI